MTFYNAKVSSPKDEALAELLRQMKYSAFLRIDYIVTLLLQNQLILFQRLLVKKFAFSYSLRNLYHQQR